MCRHDDELDDGKHREEVELLGQLIAAANVATEPLRLEELDRALGITSPRRALG